MISIKSQILFSFSRIDLEALGQILLISLGWFGNYDQKFWG